MQVTTISVFEFEGPRQQFWAFRQMGTGPFLLGKVQGLQFFKFLGSGADNGFGLWPNFSTYAWLGTWDQESDAIDFFEKNRLFAQYKKRSRTHRTFYLHNTLSHGEWDGKNPFESVKTFDPQAPVAVITRATIRKRHLPGFWRQVPRVSRSMEGKPGLQFAIGIGEAPLFLQATFSVWDSGRQMMDYAYQSEYHRDVIRQTREKGWYKEELFARFIPYKMVESSE